MFTKRLTILALILGLSFLFSCSSSNDSNEEKAGNIELIQPVVDQSLSKDVTPIITAQTLFDTKDNYFIVSVRSSEHYALGHIPGAINIPWTQIALDENLAKLPKDKKIAVYCYTGHTGAIATTILNVLGYDAYNLKFGFMAWTKDATARVATPFDEDSDANDFDVETKVNNPTNTYELADPNYLDSQDPQLILKKAAQVYLAGNPAPVITATALHDELYDGDTSDDPQIVSVRSATDYAKGHIPSAINIPWKTIAQKDNLEKLDPSRKIVVYCYTGHTGAIAATALNLLGYDAVNLKYGILSWTKNADVRVAKPFNDDTDSHDFTIEKNQ